MKRPFCRVNESKRPLSFYRLISVVGIKQVLRSHLLVTLQCRLPFFFDLLFRLSGNDSLSEFRGSCKQIKPFRSVKEKFLLSRFVIEVDKVLQRKPFWRCSLAQIHSIANFVFLQRVFIKAFQCYRCKLKRSSCSNFLIIIFNSSFF